MAHIEDFDYMDKENILGDEELQQDIVWYLQEKYNNSFTYVEEKRRNFHNRQLMLSDPSRALNTDYVKVYSALQMRKSFIATFMDDDIQVEFEWRTYADDERAYKLQLAASYDKEAMEKRKKDFMHYTHIFDYGTGIRVLEWYDEVKKCPEYKNVDPMGWLPDPSGSSVWVFEYHMFEGINTIQNLKNINKWITDIYFNIDQISEESLIDTYNEWYREQERERRLLTSYVDFRKEINLLDVFIEIYGHKYLITLANNRQLIIRFERIQAVTSEEKKNPSLIPFPINITTIFPIKEDPFGFAPLEGIIDKQNAQNRLLNLAIIQEQEKVFQKFLVDTNMMPNLDVLAQQNTNGHMYIPVVNIPRESMKGVWGAVSPLNEGNWADPNKLNLSDRMDLLMQEQTGFTDQNRGLVTPDQTLWQARIQQQNSNLQFSLDASQLHLWERDFWLNIWYRTQKQYISDTNKKIFRIGTQLASVKLEITTTDFLSWIDPDIKVESKRSKMDKWQRRLTVMNAERPLIQQDPSIPQVSKNIYRREKMKLEGHSREFIMATIPLTKDERRAKQYLEIINEWIDVRWLFQKWMDLDTYWIYLSQAQENDVKEKVLNQLQKRMTEQEKQPQWQPAEGWQPAPGQSAVGNAIASQQNSALISQWAQQEQAILQWV